ncbi:MAG: hypothetical protein ACKVKJ_06790 [Fidelibacterota bacterium]|jgi:hypothetical protein|tara:strand:- start:109 stop:243 length:135 start_codon:yes stop_codon:yes gene_type:complete
MSDALKTVFKYDAGARGFKRASLVLFFLAGLLAIFGIFWLYSWI